MGKQVTKPTATAAAAPAAKAAAKKKAAKVQPMTIKREVYEAMVPSVKARCAGAIILVKVQYGAIVTEMRGKVGGHVFSRNSSGGYMRPKTIPVNPNTPAQIAVKGIFNDNSAAWRNLTQAQRDSFITYAPEYTNLNVWGSSQPLTGQQLYMRLNQNLASFGQAGIVSCIPPVEVTVPFATDLLADISLTNLLLNGIAPTGDDEIIGIYATAPYSAGRQFVGKSQFKIVDFRPVTSVLDDLDILTPYTAVFGNPLVNGNLGCKITVKLVRINTSNGQPSPEVRVTGVIVA